VRKFVLVVDRRERPPGRNITVTLGARSSMALRVVTEGLTPDDKRHHFNRPLMRGAGQAQRFTPQQSSNRFPAFDHRPSSRRQLSEKPWMRLSHFFIDGRSSPRGRFDRLRHRRPPVVFRWAAACRQYPEIAPPVVRVSGQYPGAERRTWSPRRWLLRRAADQRRRETMILHDLKLDRRWPFSD